MGNFILDFYCSEHKICIEADGGQHYEDSAIKNDKKREKYLARLGITVIRFENTDIIRNIKGVSEDIFSRLLTLTLSSKRGEGEIRNKIIVNKERK